MKKNQLKSILLGTALLAGIVLPANAQIGEQRHNFAIGINGGANSVPFLSNRPLSKTDY